MRSHTRRAPLWAGSPLLLVRRRNQLRRLGLHDKDGDPGQRR